MTTKPTKASEGLYARAVQLMPGGVNSPVRAFKAVGGHPLFFSRGFGSHLWDADGNEYVDFVSSWGAIIHGHADEEINLAIGWAAENGTSFGAPHEGEIDLAEEIVGRVPGLERLRFVNSGTEATVAAIRLARAATGRSKIIKFDGNYHGAADCLLAHAGSGVATLSLPDSSGIPPGSTADTLVAKFNNLDSVEMLFNANLNEVAAVIVEPTSGNMGLVPVLPGFLERLNDLCKAHGALFILDEVMTGFRVAAGGAAERFGIYPDLYCFGKVIGGGLPVGAYGGSSELMKWVAPEGLMYQAGTLSGNPLAMAAGYAAVSRLGEEQYSRLEYLGNHLETVLRIACDQEGVAAQVQRLGSMISVFFVQDPVVDFDGATKTDRALYSKVFQAMLNHGFYLPPSALEAWFLTLSHTEDEIDRAGEAFALALRGAA